MRETTRTTALLVAAAIAMAGCGGSDDNEVPASTASGAAEPVKKQKIERYVADFDAAQAERLFGDSESGVDPAELVGKWEMQLNTTLGIIDVRAPDGGGPVLDLMSDDGATFTLSERECDKPFVLGVKRTPQSLTLTRESGSCKETIDLLVEEPWRRQG